MYRRFSQGRVPGRPRGYSAGLAYFDTKARVSDRYVGNSRAWVFLNKYFIDDDCNASRSCMPAESRKAAGEGRSAAQSLILVRPMVGRARLPGHLRSARSPSEGEKGIRVPIQSNADILEARRCGRELAAELGFPAIDRTLVAAAISELARNIVLHAEEGEIRIARDERPGSAGIVVTAVDSGPGIGDLRAVLHDGYSASHNLGLGLPGVRRIVDDFDIASKPRQGTTVTVKKWKPR
jgi:serine/threonine-protein kinase RsbT